MDDSWSELSEMRFSPGGRILIVAGKRGGKPEGSSEGCIFCPEKQHLLEKPEVGEAAKDFIRAAEQRGFYVVKNKYPVVSSRESGSGESTLGVYYTRKTARGAHWVIIEPEHGVNPFSDDSASYYRNLAFSYREVLRALKAEDYMWAGIGKNRNGVNGAKAGSSQPHHHSQAIATDFLPRWIKDYDRMGNFELIKDGSGHDMLHGCHHCMEARNNRWAETRLFYDEKHLSFVSPAPDESQAYSKEIQILPYNHQGFFDRLSDGEVESFGRILHNTMVMIGSTYPLCGYNFELRNGPWASEHGERPYHWQFYIYPASPELGNARPYGIVPHLLGASVVTESPEKFAARLKGKK